MAARRLWLLNFDAERELAHGAGTSSVSVRARFAPLVQHIGPLVPDGDAVLGIDPVERTREASAGRAWCPTPSALRALREAGATPPDAPPVHILRQVNHRRFCASLGATLPDACFVTDLPSLARVVARATSSGHWLLKRAFGFAGRGRRRIVAGALEQGAMDWIAASFRAHGGLQVEPCVARAGDFSLHGFVPREGSTVYGQPVAQRVDEHGAWCAAARAAPDALGAQEHSTLCNQAAVTADALHTAGYFGPFGIDAFRWIDADGCTRFNARCEINARYTMGYAIGMGALRPDL